MREKIRWLQIGYQLFKLHAKHGGFSFHASACGEGWVVTTHGPPPRPHYGVTPEKAIAKAMAA